MGDSTLESLFPGLLRVVINRVSDCFDWLGGGVVWSLVFRRSLSEVESREYENLF